MSSIRNSARNSFRLIQIIFYSVGSKLQVSSKVHFALIKTFKPPINHQKISKIRARRRTAPFFTILQRMKCSKLQGDTYIESSDCYGYIYDRQNHVHLKNMTIPSHLSEGPSGSKQKCTQLPAIISGTVFHALSQDKNWFDKQTL